MDEVAAAQFESCGGSRGTCVKADASHQPWWPFADCARKRQLTFCEQGGDCHGPVRPSRAVVRLCGADGDVSACRNLSLNALRAAGAHGALR